MMKVALRHAEYMATLPPYRFLPGDVIEVDDEHGENMIRRGIAVKAKANAQTAMERRVAQRPATPDDGGAAVRAERRAILQAEMEALDREDAAPRPAAEGHYSDMITRDAPPMFEEPADADDTKADDKTPARASRK
jgi:hypothetical protein